MAELTQIIFENFGPCKAVGVAIRIKPLSQDIKNLWRQTMQDGTFDRLFALNPAMPPNFRECCVGYMTEYDVTDSSFVYLAGIFVPQDTLVPAEFTGFDIPAGMAAKAWIKGPEIEIYPQAHMLTENAARRHGYEPDYSRAYSCEVYTDARFSAPIMNGESIVVLDYYLPVRKI